MSADNRPTKKQHELLVYLDGFIKNQGYGPSYREVMRALNYKSVSTVAAHIDGLIARGYLRKKDNSARSLEVMVFSDSSTPKKSAGASHTDWFDALIKEKIAAGMTDADRKTVVKALELLELHDLSVKYDVPIDEASTTNTA